MNQDELKKDLGIGNLPKEQQDVLLAQISHMLNLRIGMAIADTLSDDKLEEFQAVIEKNDEAETISWLDQNFPDYKNVVTTELKNIKADIIENVNEMS